MRVVANPYFPPYFDLYDARSSVGKPLSELIGEPWEGGPDEITMASHVIEVLPTDTGTAYVVVLREGVRWLVTHPCYPGEQRADVGRITLNILWE